MPDELGKTNGGFSIRTYERKNHFDFWCSMVTRYSSRQLTHYKDVLPAVAGLANAITGVQHCEYIQGLWKEDLYIGLDWFVVGNDRVINPSYNFMDKDKPVFSTWLWASQWGKWTEFLQNRAVYRSIEALRVRFSWQRSQRTRCGSIADPPSRTTSLLLTGKARLAIIESKNKNIMLLCADHASMWGHCFQIKQDCLGQSSALSPLQRLSGEREG